MFSRNFIKFIKSFKSKKNSDLNCIIDLGRLGMRIAQEYSVRFDLLPIEKCLYLSEFQTPVLEKAEKHLLNLVPKFDPLFSLMEYYDNYPYLYSDINYSFKGCLKTGVEISIKAVNKTTKNNYFKKVNSLRNKLKYYSFLFPWMEKDYKIKEVFDQLEENSMQKLTLSNEIAYTTEFSENLKQYREKLHLEKVKFLKMYVYLSSEQMVVSEYIYGSYFHELIAKKALRYEDAILLIRAQLFFMLKIGKFYNNIHSANLMLDEEQNIYFLDCNTVETIAPNTKLQLFRLLKALCLGNFPYASVILNELSDSSLNSEQLEELSNTIKEIMTNSKEKTNEVFFVKVMRMFRSTALLGAVFPEKIFPIFKSFIYLDSLLFVTKNKNSKIKTDILNILNDIEEILSDNIN